MFTRLEFGILKYDIILGQIYRINISLKHTYCLTRNLWSYLITLGTRRKNHLNKTTQIGLRTSLGDIIGINEKCRYENFTYLRSPGVIAQFAKTTYIMTKLLCYLFLKFYHSKKFFEDFSKMQTQCLNSCFWKIGSGFSNLVVILAVESSILCSIYKHGTKLYINSSQICRDVQEKTQVDGSRNSFWFRLT